MPVRPQQSLRTAAQQPPSGGLAVAFAIVSAVALFAVMFPWFPGSQRLEPGTVLAADVVAPRSLTYESGVLTLRQREEAMSAIEDVLINDTEIRDRQLAELDRIFSAIDRQREDEVLSASAKETAIQAITGTLSQRAAATIVQASENRWTTMRQEGRDALSRALTGAVAPDQVEATRSRVAGLITPLLSDEEELALIEILDPLVVPTLTVSEERTNTLREEAGANTPPVRVTYQAGQVVVPAGTAVDEAAYEAIRELDIRTGAVTWVGILAAAIAAALAGAAMGAHLWVARVAALRGARRLAIFLLALLVPVAIAKFAFPILLPDDERLFIAHALPLAAGALIAAVLLDVSSGVIVAVLTTALVSFLAISASGTGAGNEYEPVRLGLAVLAAALTALYVGVRVERLPGYLGATLIGAAAAVEAATLVLLFDPQREWRDAPWLLVMSAGSGLLTATIAMSVIGLLSKRFGIVTRVELVELVQLNHPLLRRLQDEAPGTFQHSMLVGSLADRAADRIGADSLLVRVGAYYHDIGKLHSPGFFVENFGDGPNPHDNLDPLQSSRVIQRHVSAGIDLARKHHLPESVVAFIPQHHGTRLVSYFYREAAKLKPDVDPAQFRYPGPKPQTRETALVMLADSCEASVRARSDRSAEGIRQTVDGIIRERIEEGQFDECDLSLQDLRIIASSFTQALSAVYHPRVEYPEPTRRELQARGSAPNEAPRPPSRPVITTDLTVEDRPTWSENDA